ncbi:DNA polymerase iota [Aspergillus costaricaensis CBS 115574]|uniref:DNA polymerase iota n=1 Tax=Aspergillus costaricaensis CBS 115574 TaxID=1448317 RepID=A0ACD1IQW8_9EURO|nr:DNA polymerase iota [Aspergillus costaricaensis CBS 115574]RAK92870.1 DNA polymerase iota [Aspergillus costaricaensis CBS 115574]
MSDYDCFYASVFEVEQPVLKTLPLAVQQKQIVVTCNYEARRRGLRKLQLIKEAKQICPDVVIVLGEDLSRFRDASKDLFLYIRSFVWGEKVERLGFDEDCPLRWFSTGSWAAVSFFAIPSNTRLQLFLDVTEMINYNVDLLNRYDLEHSFFHLDRHEPTVGFTYDATRLCGSTYPADSNTVAAAAPSTTATADEDASAWLYTRLLVASHLAGYLRGQLEQQKGYTATVGISTSKLLAKLAGSTHKPNNQTTLLPPYTTPTLAAPSNVLNFLDAHEIRKIPGIGSKLTRKLCHYLADEGAHSVPAVTADDTADSDKVTVRDIRLLPGMGPSLLSRILGGPGAPRDIGVRVWGLLHGVDNTEVVQAGELPTQISIEDSYGRLDSFDSVRRELVSLTGSLLRRMRTDLTEKDRETDSTAANQVAVSKIRWLAHPRTLRLSTRPRSATDNAAQAYHGGRISRSAPLPGYVFHLDESVDALAERLVQDQLLSMFRKLHPERSGWNLRLMNVAVTNLVEAAGERKQSSGRDIGKMFQSQGSRRNDALAISGPVPVSTGNSGTMIHVQEPLHRGDGAAVTDNEVEEAAWEESDGEDGMACVACGVCGAMIPHFAREAHEAFHLVPD